MDHRRFNPVRRSLGLPAEPNNGLRLLTAPGQIFLPSLYPKPRTTHLETRTQQRTDAVYAFWSRFSMRVIDRHRTHCGAGHQLQRLNRAACSAE